MHKDQNSGPLSQLVPISSLSLSVSNPFYKWQQTIPETVPPQSFPDDLLATLIDIYFRQFNPLALLLHSGIFRASVAARVHLRDHNFGAVVLAVCALASRLFSDNPRVLIADDAPQHSAGWKWFRQIQPIRLILLSTSPHLFHLGHFINCNLFVYGSYCLSLPIHCWILASLGIRLAQEMGAHRRSCYAGGSTSEAELLRHAFWFLLAMDAIMSSLFGRPTVTRSEDYDIDLPTECDDEYWGEPYCFQQPAHKPSLAAYTTGYLKLMKIFTRAQHAILVSELEFVRSLESFHVLAFSLALNQWTNSIPSHLQWDPNREGIFLDQSTCLIPFVVQMLIHRPFVSAPGMTAIAPVSSAYPSLAILTNSARSLARVLEVQSRRSGHILYQPQAIVILFILGYVAQVCN
ncbi:fungal-specific transcription factor domain-containing protein [Mycena maculata]|uniref:Fungal-specific transcription factor domain-containing protein n=1 Tax=Mycena maculata TaxID=230809 RepID=A0AAD7HK48_9AGAR|nr:fungal-specific transcription factor domain-containing protein [Mycena maculata]